MYRTHPRRSRSREDNFLKISLWKSGRRVFRLRYMPRTTTHERRGAYDQANKVVRVFVLLLVSKALWCWSPFCRMIDKHSPELWTKSTAVLTLCSRNFWEEVTTSISSFVGTLRCKKPFCDFHVSEVKPANKPTENVGSFMGMHLMANNVEQESFVINEKKKQGKYDKLTLGGKSWHIKRNKTI